MLTATLERRLAARSGQLVHHARCMSTASSSDPSPATPSSSDPSSTPAASSSSAAAVAAAESTTPAAEASKKARIDQLWDRVVRAPHAISNTGSASKPSYTSNDPITHSPRLFRGTTRRTMRHRGQTPHEAGAINDSLAGMFRLLEQRALRPRSRFELTPSPDGRGLTAPAWERMISPPKSWRTNRVEDESPALSAAIDALTEELAALTSAPDVVSWAQRRVFARETGFDRRLNWPATYPRALSATMHALRTTHNAPHLALAVFEHARSLGVESYLAGCQTSAYNELIGVRWESFRDLGGVAAAVREMEQHAIAWSRPTARIVENVVKAVSSDILRQGRGGAPPAPLPGYTLNAELGASSSRHWGPDAYSLLAQLEKCVADDKAKQEKMYGAHVRHARRHRAADRERELAMRGGASGSEFGPVGYFGGRERQPRAPRRDWEESSSQPAREKSYESFKKFDSDEPEPAPRKYVRPPRTFFEMRPKDE